MLKKAKRYLILHEVKSSGLAFSQGRSANPQFTRREVSGEEAMAFLRTLSDATGYEIYELQGKALVMQTTVVVAEQAEVLAQEIGKADAGDE